MEAKRRQINQIILKKDNDFSFVFAKHCIVLIHRLFIIMELLIFTYEIMKTSQEMPLSTQTL